MPYNRAILRELVTAAFSGTDLTIFFSDHFKEVYDNVPETQEKDLRIVKLLDYVETHEGFEHLANLVKADNAAKYLEFEARLLEAAPEPDPHRQITDALLKIQKELETNPHYKDLKEKFELILEEISRLSDYKVLHDGLHEIQYSLYHNILASTKIVVDDKYANLDLNQYVLKYRREITKMKGAAKNKNVDPEEDLWITQLEQAGNDLVEGIKKVNKTQIDGATQTINQVIGFQPNVINTKLYQAVYAYNQGLPKPTDLMEKVREKLNAIYPDSEKAKQFQKGIDSLKEINTKLRALIMEHNTWQDVDRQLRILPDLLEAGIPAFNKRWQTIRPRIEPYYANSDDSGLKDADDLLGVAITKDDLGKVRTAFDIYYSVAAERFYYVDKSVLELCDRLRLIRDELV